MRKRIVCMAVIAVMLVTTFAVMGYKKDWSRHFDLSEETRYWDQAAFEDRYSSGFGDNWHESVESIYIIFKATTTYPKLTKRDLKLKNVKEFYYTDLKPSGDMGNIPIHQIAEIMLKDMSKEKIIEAISHLKMLPFTLSAGLYMKGEWVDH